MNYIQFILFFSYIFCVLCGGMGLYVWLNPKRQSFLNNYILIGESLLLGSILTIGMMLLLSVLHLYNPFCLWGVVLLNLITLFNKNVRAHLALMLKVPKFSLLEITFWILLVIFFVRNVYFIVDVDSHSSYLFAQKLWLHHGTSIFSQIGLDDRIYAAHFDGVPYALTLSWFGNDIIFPMLINFLWRAISLILVFGYVRYRFNSMYALAGVMLILFNDHFFISRRLSENRHFPLIIDKKCITE